MATRRRRSSIDRAAVQSILTPGETGQPAAPPSPHVGNSPNRAYFAMDPPPRPVTHHSRTQSYNQRRPNRLSLSFPVALNTNSESTRPTPTSSTLLSIPPTPTDTVTAKTPTDSGEFLVALAAQERKVFELKEELDKAESELKHLKKQWAHHEASKKKAELRQSEQLMPVSTVVAEGASSEATIKARRSAELERRKSLLNNLNIPEGNRRKFSGVHQRTLSLLSPERENFRAPRQFPPLREVFEQNGLTSNTPIPDTSYGITKVSSSRASQRHSYQSGMTNNAKQIAEDLKAGVWTFLEDLRQATVGDEAVNGTSSQSNMDTSVKTPRKSSKASLPGNGRPRQSSPRTWDSLTGGNSMDAASWEDNDTSGPSTKPLVPTKKASRPLSLAPAIADLDDDWSNWDSPTPKSPRWSASTTMSDMEPGTPSSSNVEDHNVKIMPEDSEMTSSKRDSIQWPALDSLSPGALKGNLQRTMSTIMKEWEKSIVPTPGESEDVLIDTGVDKKTDSSSTHDEVAMMSR